MLGHDWLIQKLQPITTNHSTKSILVLVTSINGRWAAGVVILSVIYMYKFQGCYKAFDSKLHNYLGIIIGVCIGIVLIEVCNCWLQIELPMWPSIRQCCWGHMSCDIYIMMSGNGSAFRVTGPLWGESTGHRWISPYKRPVTHAFMFSLMLT